MHQLQLAQQRTDKLIVGIDPQLIEPMLHVRRHILVKEAQRAKCQRQQDRAFYEFEKCDGEQSSAAMSVRSFFGRHYLPIGASGSAGLKTLCVLPRRWMTKSADSIICRAEPTSIKATGTQFETKRASHWS